MHDVASVLADQFSALLARLPSDLDLDRLALETKAIQRKREIVDGASLLRIALARGPGGLSLRQTSAWASMLGIVELSNPAVKYRLNQATDFLAALVERLLAAKAPGAALRWPGRVLRLADGTCVSKPGSTGTDWRVHGVFDLGRGGFAHLELTDQHGAEANGHSAKAVLAVYRLRWQIELAFKRLKSLLHVDRLPTWSERGSRSWLCAHLILALLCDDLSQDVLESSP
jgi:IS4 transposase